MEGSAERERSRAEASLGAEKRVRDTPCRGREEGAGEGGGGWEKRPAWSWVRVERRLGVNLKVRS